MKNQTNGLGTRREQRLILPSDAAHKAGAEKYEKTASYQKLYQRKWLARNTRVNGSLSNEKFAELEARAKAADRKPFWQLWAESQAYLKGQRLLSLEEAENQRLIISELRRIGNNINQLARLGHLEARKHGGLRATQGDRIGAETLRQFTRLERLVTKFADGMKISVSLENDREARNDH